MDLHILLINFVEEIDKLYTKNVSNVTIIKSDINWDHSNQSNQLSNIRKMSKKMSSTKLHRIFFSCQK